MIGRADIEGSKSDVAMNAWPPQASYPCGNFSDTSFFKLRNREDQNPNPILQHHNLNKESILECFLRFERFPIIFNPLVKNNA